MCFVQRKYIYVIFHSSLLTKKLAMPEFFVPARQVKWWIAFSTFVAFAYLIAVGFEYIFALSHYNFLEGCVGCGVAYSLRVSHVINDWMSWVLLSDYLRPLYAMIWMYVVSNARKPGYFTLNVIVAAVVAVVEFAKFGVHTFAYFQFSTFWYATRPGTVPTQRSTEFYLVYFYTIGTLAYLVYVIVVSLVLRSQVTNVKGREEIEEAVEQNPGIGARMSRFGKLGTKRRSLRFREAKPRFRRVHSSNSVSECGDSDVKIGGQFHQWKGEF